MHPHTIVAEGLQFPEGPIAMDDGSVIFVEIKAGKLTRLSPDGKMSTVAVTGGGPNGAAIGPDGAIYVCNNGGFEWYEQDGMLLPGNAAADYTTGRIERVDIATGKVERLYDKTDDGLGLSGPNDIVFDKHGGFWFTDLGKHFAHHETKGGLFYGKADGSSCVCAVYGPNLERGWFVAGWHQGLCGGDRGAGDPGVRRDRAGDGGAVAAGRGAGAVRDDLGQQDLSRQPGHGGERQYRPGDADRECGGDLDRPGDGGAGVFPLPRSADHQCVFRRGGHDGRLGDAVDDGEDGEMPLAAAGVAA